MQRVGGKKTDVRNMLATIRNRTFKLKAVLRARYALRKCTSLGKLVQTYGRILVENHGKMHLGNRVRIRGTHVPVELVSLPKGVLTIGDNVFINGGTSICAQESVFIGANCLIGNYTLIMDTDFHDVGDHGQWPDARPVRIEEDVWLAVRVTVLKGVTIGRGAVVAAGAVVTRDVEPYTLVGGVPARLIRRIQSPQEQEQAREEAAQAVG